MSKPTKYRPRTLGPCGCRRGQDRDNCPQCEGTGQRIDFAALRARKLTPVLDLDAAPMPGLVYPEPGL